MTTELKLPEGLHPQTAELVVRFAQALAEKLYAAQQKYGYSDNWRRPGWEDECRAELMRHIAKGDPRDVAAYCAFLWYHGKPTTTQNGPQAPAVTLSGHELKDALEFVNPDGDSDLEQLDESVAIVWREAFVSDDNEPMPAGYYAVSCECPEEGLYGPLGKSPATGTDAESQEGTDWDCPACKKINWKSEQECQRCGHEQPENVV